MNLFMEDTDIGPLFKATQSIRILRILYELDSL